MFSKKSPSNKSPSKSVPPVEIVKEGLLNKQKKNIWIWSPRYFYLLVDGTLMGFETQPDNPFNTKRKYNFTVKDCQIRIKDRPKPYTFVIRGLDSTKPIECTFCVDSDEDRQEWLKAIKKVKESLTMSSPSVPDRPQLPSTSSSSSNDTFLEPGCTNNDDADLCNKFTASTTLEDEVSGKRKVTFQNFEFVKRLGKGAFGEVTLCREKKTSKLYAVKILLKNKVIKENEIEHTLTEKRVLQRSNHPFIISFKRSFQTDHRLFFVTEYVNGGDLYFHLNKEKFFTEGRSKFYGAEIISAIGYLHELDIIYRDMKPENVLLDKDGHIKVADFGLCKEGIGYGATTRTICGSPEYFAPEVVNDRDYGQAVDWWGVGVLMHEMMIGKLPFYNKDEEKLYELIREHEVKFPAKPSISIEARNLVSDLLVKDPSRRLGGGVDDAKELMRHPFFRSINWEDLLQKKITPPWKPQVTSDTDTRYFDIIFTGASAEFSAAGENEDEDYNDEDDVYFDGFSYKAMSSTQSLEAKNP